MAPGLIYGANGDCGRRYVASCSGQAWTLDLFIDSEYEAAQEIDPRSAKNLTEAKRMAQEWEDGLL